MGRLQTQSQIQIQEERSESATWESISTRGVARGSYPKLAASVACETSLHSIVELNTEKDVEQLEADSAVWMFKLVDTLSDTKDQV